MYPPSHTYIRTCVHMQRQWRYSHSLSHTYIHAFVSYTSYVDVEFTVEAICE